MFLPDQYQLLDFGRGQKLERFGQWILNRPSPAAEGEPGDWRVPGGALGGYPLVGAGPGEEAIARFEKTAGPGSSGVWNLPPGFPSTWTVQHGQVVFELKPTPFGHVGLFPEQAECWDWLTMQVAKWRTSNTDEALHVLNLFAYTGGSTLAAAGAGASVTHIDAAANIVAWARRNAELSGLASAPIRWITEDARKFVQRELKRGRRYQGLILDPPGYGHGPTGQPWVLEQDLPLLLSDCARLTDGIPAFLLLTCHAAQLQPRDLEQLLRSAGFSTGLIETGSLTLATPDGRGLPSGIFVAFTLRVK